MAEIKAFRGIYYNYKEYNPADLITPPYDVLTPEEVKEYKEKSPYNMVHLIKNKNYKEVKEKVDLMMQNRILLRDDSPSLYLYTQKFKIEDIGEFERIALISITRVADYNEKIILPHEKILEGPRKDRMRLLEETLMNFGFIFMFYEDKNNIEDILINYKNNYDERDFMFSFTCDFGIENTLIRISDKSLIDKIGNLIKDERFYIADGHHRYDTSLSYAKEKGNIKKDKPYNFVLSGVVSMRDKGLFVLPIYRFVHSIPNFSFSDFVNIISEYFDIKEVVKDEGFKILSDNKNNYTYLIENKEGKFFIITPKSKQLIKNKLPEVSEVLKELDVIILHKFIFEKLLNLTEEQIKKGENIKFLHSQREIEETKEAIKEELNFIVYLNPVSLDDITNVALNGEYMPQKSTLFYPKLYSGIVMNTIKDF